MATLAHPPLPVPGRNHPCPCGSRRKFKHCCLQAQPRFHPTRTAERPAPEKLLQQARDYTATGRLAEASTSLQRLIEHSPDHPEALHLLGLVAYHAGDLQSALTLLQRSIALSPDDTGFHCNLGLVLETANQRDAAIAYYRRAIALDPSRYEAHTGLARALVLTGALLEACIHLRQAIQLRPQLPGPVNDLGVLLARLGKPEAAFTCYRQALTLDLRHAPAHNNMGALLESQGRHGEAVASLEAALAANPGFADAHSNLAASLSSLGRFDDALASARRALELQPTDIEALLNLGNALKHQGRFEQAALYYQQAADLAPSDPRPWNNLAETRRDQGQIAPSAQSYRRALELQPGNAAAFSNLLYLHAFSNDISLAEQLTLARGWEQALLTSTERAEACHAASAASGIFPATPSVGRALRLGIVSAELGTHAVAEFLQPFLEHLDRDRFHLTLFPTVGRTDARAAHIRSLADAYVPLLGLSDTEAVHQVRSHAIDILIDTSGHTTGNRLGIFARRAAPIQCTWIGYWNTTGLTEMDYVLSDLIAPPGAEQHFSEQFWPLPRLNISYRGDPDLEITWKPDPDGTIWLGSLNKFAKIREESIALWSTALHALPKARLLLEDRGSDESESHRRIRSTFAQHGIAPERIEFISYVPGHERHMALYNRLDIALDTLPFNSGTTAFDALWMGVPLVTVEGNWSGGRIAGGLLHTLGHPEWIAPSPGHFAAIVQSLAHDIDYRRQLRATQRQQMAASPLCDALSLTRHLENAFTEMYDRWRTDLP